MASEADEVLKKIQGFKGVVGSLVVNNEGTSIKSTLDNTTTVQYAGLFNDLVDKAKSVVRELDPTNDLTFLRIKSKKNEILVATDKDFKIITVHCPSE